MEKKGIWKYSSYLPLIAGKYKLTLGEGSTPLVKKNGIWFKCEYKNPSGSVKDRSICYQFAKLKEEKFDKAVISSSGNAAISASYYAKLHEIPLNVFVSEHINRLKLSEIRENAKVIKSEKPVSRAVREALDSKTKNLRQSTDPYGSVGYRTISLEINEILPGVDAVFIPVSSGAILKGVFQGFAGLARNVALHAVQSTKIHKIAEVFDHDFIHEENSFADSIVAKYLPLKDEVQKIIKSTRGSAWVISNQEIILNKKYLDGLGLESSYEGGLVLAALHKAEKKGFKYKKPVCLLTGKFYASN